ncbi:hypothetical protein J2S43_005759 [Catenuloplanes nepalensis]|uniref:DUF1508 domain-containing protein n=1 Tax=Catenuloplanes nepalensis TaxID=587533 RepID=A0ABT9N0M2_9ACTN|nr:hypothetical protein [Catenuloplanes nepalensis]MDP9797247.1 hypothetical protein [Catenuloplanes nepalensis]
MWRLVGPNNRVIGVSPTSFDGADAAVEAAQNVRSRAAGGAVTVQLDAFRQWCWSITDGELGLLAVSAHGYERRTTCELAVQRFTESAATAQIDQAIGRRGRFWRPGAE